LCGRYLHLMDIKMNDHRSLRMPRGVRGKIVGNEVARRILLVNGSFIISGYSSLRNAFPLTTVRTRRRGIYENFPPAISGERGGPVIVVKRVSLEYLGARAVPDLNETLLCAGIKFFRQLPVRVRMRANSCRPFSIRFGIRRRGKSVDPFDHSLACPNARPKGSLLSLRSHPPNPR